MLGWVAGFSTQPTKGIYRKAETAMTGSQNMLSGLYCPPGTGHNDLQCAREGNPGCFILVTGTEETTLWAFPLMQKLVHYTEKEKKKLGNLEDGSEEGSEILRLH